MGGQNSGGHNRKPTAQKRVEGNRGRRKLSKPGIKVELGEPEMPPLAEVAARHWREIVPILLSRRVLTPADGPALAAYCTCFARAEQCRLEIDRAVTISRDVERLMRLEFKALTLMKSFLIELGLTPASRPRLQPAANEPTPDALEAFLASYQRLPKEQAVLPTDNEIVY